MLPSIRGLTIGATSLRTAVKAQSDPDAQINFFAAQHRVALALRLVSGYLLLDSLNQRYSADNALRLETELRQHDLLLAGIEAEVHEVQFRHSLNELNAYHSGGFTADDFHAIFQDITLTAISVGTNRNRK